MNSETPHVTFLFSIIRPLVENQDAVKVDQSVDEMGVLLTLDVAQADMGKIIGKQGHTVAWSRAASICVSMSLQARAGIRVEDSQHNSMSTRTLTSRMRHYLLVKDGAVRRPEPWKAENRVSAGDCFFCNLPVFVSRGQNITTHTNIRTGKKGPSHKSCRPKR